jgi:DNA end-binding protein Ku
MPRSIWTGSIGFGLVSVPVKLYSAITPKTVRFHQLHKSDHVRIQQKRICPADEQEVAFEDIVKGYEIGPEQYVVVEPEDFASVQPEKAKRIAIEDFVDLAEIDPIYYDHAYYLVPGQGGASAYQLLLGAMRDTQKVAIARVVMRGKEHLVAIRPMGEVLGMATMNFADEVLSTDLLEELPSEQAELSDRERAVAEQLVNSLAVPFDATRYHDTYRQALLELIERKAKGKKVKSKPSPQPAMTAPDLMSALKASLAEVRERGGSATAAKKPSRSNGASKRPRARAETVSADQKPAPTPKPKPKSPRASAKRAGASRATASKTKQ